MIAVKLLIWKNIMDKERTLKTSGFRSLNTETIPPIRGIRDQNYNLASDMKT